MGRDMASRGRADAVLSRAKPVVKALGEATGLAPMPSNLPSGPSGPAVLNGLNWIFRPIDLEERAKARFGDAWTLRLLGGERWVVLSRPDLIEQVFAADGTVLHGGEGNNIAASLLGPHSVLLLDEHEHTVQRKLLRPFFYGERLDRYPELMASICEEELAGWPLNQPFPLLPRLEAITVRIIMNVIYGLGRGTNQDELLKRVRNLIAFGDSNIRMIGFRLTALRGNAPKQFVAVRDPVDEQIYLEIDRARRDPALPDRDDVLAMLLRARHEDGSPMSDRELRDELMTLTIQGHQSTATALAWALERLIRHPTAFERLRAEADTGSDEYLDVVIKETLRMRPPLPVTMRLVKQPYRLGEWDLEPGVRICVSTYQVHRRPELYPDPERYHPERFFEEPGASAMWIPFGGGERHCIGRSFATAVMKIVLRTLAVQARLRPADPADEEVKHRRVQFSPGKDAVAILTERRPAAPAPVHS
jgi:cytochrome P450 family 135